MTLSPPCPSQTKSANPAPKNNARTLSGAANRDPVGTGDHTHSPGSTYRLLLSLRAHCIASSLRQPGHHSPVVRALGPVALRSRPFGRPAFIEEEARSPAHTPYRLLVPRYLHYTPESRLCNPLLQKIPPFPPTLGRPTLRPSNPAQPGLDRPSAGHLSQPLQQGRVAVQSAGQPLGHLGPGQRLPQFPAQS